VSNQTNGVPEIHPSVSRPLSLSPNEVIQKLCTQILAYCRSPPYLPASPSPPRRPCFDRLYLRRKCSMCILLMVQSHVFSDLRTYTFLFLGSILTLFSPTPDFHPCSRRSANPLLSKGPPPPLMSEVEELTRGLAAQGMHSEGCFPCDFSLF
jgi:hypothetical protein